MQKRTMLDMMRGFDDANLSKVVRIFDHDRYQTQQTGDRWQLNATTVPEGLAYHKTR